MVAQLLVLLAGQLVGAVGGAVGGTIGGAVVDEERENIPLGLLPRDNEAMEW